MIKFLSSLLSCLVIIFTLRAVDFPLGDFDRSFWGIVLAAHGVGLLIVFGTTRLLSRRETKSTRGFLPSMTIVLLAVTVLNYWNAIRYDSVTTDQAVAVAGAAAIFFVQPFVNAIITHMTGNDRTSSTTPGSLGQQAA